MSLSFLRRIILFSFEDVRHWNNDENRYVDYNNPAEVEKYW